MSTRSSRAAATAAILLLLAAATLPAQAVIIDSGDGTGNTSAPADDPGWANVGQNAGFSGVYLGDGWILTAQHANHVNARFAGILYQALPGSQVVLDHPTDAFQSDLKLYRLQTYPALPTITIRNTKVSNGSSTIMGGRGRDRGAAFSFKNPPNQDDAYWWGTTKTRRWGTNVVASNDTNIDLAGLRTLAFATVFDRNQPDHEGLASDGDSGGAVFIKRLGSWELAGIMFAVSGVNGQPAGSAAYENVTWSADLSYYRDQILDVITPQCGNGHLTIDEDCDDGNTANGDCCSSTCQFESNGSACDDGLICTSGDSCDGAGSCNPGSANPCDDALFCNGDESCDEVLGCGPGTPPDPDDGVPCTIDNCDEMADLVVNFPNHGACDDGAFCNGAEICDAISDCIPGPPLDLSDTVACTLDSCDEDQDIILHEPDHAACDDEIACTADSCDAQTGCAHTPILTGPCAPPLVPAAGPRGQVILLVCLAAIGSVLAAHTSISKGTHTRPDSSA